MAPHFNHLYIHLKCLTNELYNQTALSDASIYLYIL